MTRPQPGTLQYVILNKLSVSIKQDDVEIIISDGLSARITNEKAPKDASLNDIPHQILLQLWNTGQVASMRQWREAKKKRDSSLLSVAIDEILRILDSSAMPDISIIIAAVQRELLVTEKMDDWNKLNNLLQSLDEKRLREFLSLMILLLLSKSAEE